MSLELIKRCDICGRGMCDGYVINGGDMYACSDDCLRVLFPTDAAWNAECQENDDSYYTEWYDGYDPEYDDIYPEFPPLDIINRLRARAANMRQAADVDTELWDSILDRTEREL